MVRLDLEHGVPAVPRHEAGQHSLACSAGSDEEAVAEALAEDAVDAEDMVDHLVEDNERHVELLLVENLRARGEDGERDVWREEGGEERRRRCKA
eukprot:767203-Hanusia_phi.AAC.5